MKINFNGYLSKLPMLVAANVFFTLLYFLLFHLSSWWWGAFGMVMLIFCFFYFLRNPSKIKRMLFISPSAALLIVLACANTTYYFGAWLEFKIREKEFIGDVMAYQRGVKSISELRWPSWNESAVNMKDFVYSEQPLPSELMMQLGSGGCKKLSKKLRGNFYITYYLNCDGPLF